MKYDFSVMKDHKTFNRLYPLAKLVRACTFDSRATGLENIPEKKDYIIACNHIHALDPGQILLALDGRPVHFMGKSEFWDNPFIGRFLTRLNGFPVVRGKADMTSLNYAADLVKNGFTVAVFPEGTRSKDGKIGRAKSGVSYIARTAHADVLPMSFYYEGELKKGCRITVRIGELIPYEDLHLTDDGDHNELRAATAIIWDKVNELHDMGHCKELWENKK